jgi:protein-tyrosine phosphatase
MIDILDLIDQKIRDGDLVYTHCFRGLGRTGIVVACYLIRHGMTNQKALEYIPNLRIGVAGDFRSSPETEVQRKFVLNWEG